MNAHDFTDDVLLSKAFKVPEHWAAPSHLVQYCVSLTVLVISDFFHVSQESRIAPSKWHTDKVVIVEEVKEYGFTRHHQYQIVLM